MPLNPLNLQMSVPRVPEASTIQQQALQKPVMDQAELAEKTIKHTEQSRTQTQKTNEVEKAIIRDENHAKQQHQQQQKKHKNQQQQTNAGQEKSIHPYKGHSIDIKL